MTTSAKENAMILNWKVSKADSDLIVEIVLRANRLAEKHGQEPIPQLVMDITACHNHGCRLDLERLADAPDFDFAHDVWGIHRHIDRNTGELGDCFLPRCAARVPVETSP